MEGLIGVVSEDDFLVASEDIPIQISAGNQLVGDCSTLETNYALGRNRIFKVTKHIEQALNMSESMEQKQTKSGKCNLRKSLAWDSAFFTNEGVLDAEELSIVNGMFRKVDVHSLSSIAEDVRKSNELTSTLDNDSWLLENLEVELFDSVRASIQKSLGHDGKVANVVRSSATKPLTKINSRPLKSLKMVESSIHNKKKTPTPDTKCVSYQQPKPDSREDINGCTTSKRVFKPPRMLSRPTLPAMTNKGTSASRNNQTGSAASKVLSGKVPSQKSVAIPKKLNGTLNSSTSTTSKSLRPTGTSIQDISPTTSCSSYSSSISNSSETASKPTSGAMRKKIASRNVNHSSELVSAKNPTKIARTRLIDQKPCNTSLGPTCTSKFSSTISPHSSLDSVASGSSSASFVFKSSSGSSDPGSSSSLSYCSPVKGLVISCLEQSLGNESRKDCCLSQSIKGPREMFVTAEPSRSSNSITSAKSLKPSGLRMPTPKFGYFDAEKSVTRNVDSFPHIRQQSLLRTSTGAGETFMETIPNNNIGSIPWISPQDKSPQSTAASVKKSNAVNKLKSTNPQPVSTPSWSKAMNNPDCSPVQFLHTRAIQDIESAMIEQLLVPADSCSIQSTVEAYDEPQVVPKTPFLVKDCHSKIHELATEENKKIASEKLMVTPSGGGNQLLNSMMNNPLEENILAFKVETPDSYSRKVAWALAMEKQCHLVTTTMDKENILPVGSTDTKNTYFPNKNMGVELLGAKISSLRILD